MLFTVAGVSGHTGKVVADTLLQQGHTVRVLVRDPAKGEAWAARGAEVAIADVSDPVGLAEALRGADGAWLLVPPNLASGDFRGWQRKVSESIVSATRASGVPHIVLLSSVAAHLPEGTGPIKALYPLERDLREIPGLGATFLRAGYFMENLPGNFGMLAQGVLPSFSPADLPIPMIATEDIGRLGAALLLEGPPPAGAPRVVELGGPDVTTNDVAAALSALLGRPIQVAVFPVEAMAQTLTGYGFPADIAALYQEMTSAMNSGLARFEGGHRRVLGTTSIQDFLARVVSA